MDRDGVTGRPGRRPWRHLPSRRLAVGVATLALALHTLAVVTVWMGWGRGLRGGALVWIDLPVSLAYLHLVGRRLLVWSLLAGGAWWALVGAMAAWLVGLLAGRRPGPQGTR